jgi:hypothetical protein
VSLALKIDITKADFKSRDRESRSSITEVITSFLQPSSPDVTTFSRSSGLCVNQGSFALCLESCSAAFPATIHHHSCREGTHRDRGLARVVTAGAIGKDLEHDKAAEEITIESFKTCNYSRAKAPEIRFSNPIERLSTTP